MACSIWPCLTQTGVAVTAALPQLLLASSGDEDLDGGENGINRGGPSQEGALFGPLLNILGS